MIPSFSEIFSELKIWLKCCALVTVSTKNLQDSLEVSWVEVLLPEHLMEKVYKNANLYRTIS